jgi:hypothetical protein
MPHHPENVGETVITNHDRIPLVKVQGPDGKVFVPVYTKARHAHHAMKSMNQRFDILEMLGKELFDVLANHNVKVAINVRSGIGQIMMNENSVRKIADGSILETGRNSPTQNGAVQALEPADYPTNLVQPLFQFLRGRTEVRAAWIFRQVTPDPSAPPCYVIGLLMPQESDAVKQDVAIICKTSCPPPSSFGVTTLNPQEPVMAAVLKQFQPFYAAPDFQWPQGLETEA